MHRLVVLALLAVVFAAVSPCLGQAEFYSLSHPFGIPTATTTRLFGMGGFVTCIPDRGFANPAFAGSLTSTQAVARQSLTRFEGGLQLKGQQASVAFPLKDDKRGVQLVGFRLSSDPGLVQLAGAPPLSVSMSEHELSVHYGQRVSSNLMLGLGLGPVFHNSVNFGLYPMDAPFAQYRSEADQGVRFGAVYECGSRGRLGFVYDRYDEDVVAGGMLFGGGPLEFSFKSEELVAGFSYQLTDQLLGAIEWQQLTTEGEGVKVGDAGWRIGFEGVTENKWAYRVGSNDGAVSLGLGYLDDDWTFNYAFVRNWNDDLVGELLGASKTHQFELTYSW